MPDLQRITTEYVEAEDRLRLSGERPDGSTVVLWLTLRMAVRLVPPLCRWLEQHTTAAGAPLEVVQEFAQQAALAALEPAPPVRATGEARAWLVHSVDVNIRNDLVQLGFKAEGQGEVLARIAFAPQPLRQWLGILHDQFRKADWPLAAWPEWVTEARPRPPEGQGGVLH
ncbi:hypothetical protein ACT80S_03620 [Ramlibacter sp. MAHUQ-53]|uniref:hypothetical protein n=1 Tax=unclassified Ramlibacter TaxID=2617605 RepID=UPI00362C311C